MAQSANLEPNILDCIYAVPEEAATRSTGPPDPGPSHADRDNSHWQSDRLTMAIASTVRHDPTLGNKRRPALSAVGQQDGSAETGQVNGRRRPGRTAANDETIDCRLGDGAVLLFQ
jgi:hypothetical protein